MNGCCLSGVILKVISALSSCTVDRVFNGTVHKETVVIIVGTVGPKGTTVDCNTACKGTTF